MCKRPKATDGGNKKVQYNKYMHVYIYVKCVYMHVCMPYKEEFSPDGFELPFSLKVAVIS